MAKTYKQMLDEALRGTVQAQQAETPVQSPTPTEGQTGTGQEKPQEVKTTTTEAAPATTTVVPEAETTNTTDKKNTNTTAAGTVTTPVAPTPAKPVTIETPKPPSWQDLVDELQAVDEKSEKRKEEIRKKQRIAKGIAALGDFATHALNVWGAYTGGKSAPLKGAPLTEAFTAREKEMLEEHAKKIEEYKKNRAQSHKWLYDERVKAAELAAKQELSNLQRLKAEAEIEYRNEMTAYRHAKTEQEKEMHRKNLEKIDAQIANYEDQMAKRGTSSSSSKRTYTVDGETYDDIYDAWAALPDKVREAEEAKMQDDFGNRKDVSKHRMAQVIAQYNRNPEGMTQQHAQANTAKTAQTAKATQSAPASGTPAFSMVPVWQQNQQKDFSQFKINK